MEPSDHDPDSGGDGGDGLAAVKLAPVEISFVVAGEAEPQGSKVAMLIGWRPGQRYPPKVKLEESGNTERADGSKGNARAWRNRVRAAAAQAMVSYRRPIDTDKPPLPFPLDGPAALDVVFEFARPKSHLKKSGGLVKGAPRYYASSHDVGDLSKLVRAVEDALAEAGALTDDARISKITATKIYAPTGVLPCCRITLTGMA